VNDGYCPQCLLDNRRVELMINADDIWECPDCNLQLHNCNFFFMAVMRKRGHGDLKNISSVGRVRGKILTKASVEDEYKADTSGFKNEDDFRFFLNNDLTNHTGRTIMKDDYPDQSIYERDKFKCQYCELDASKDFETWWHANLNIDHIQPKSHGGTNDPTNLVVACRACNLYKGSAPCRSLDEARQIVREKRAQAERWFKKYVLKES